MPEVGRLCTSLSLSLWLSLDTLSLSRFLTLSLSVSLSWLSLSFSLSLTLLSLFLSLFYSLSLSLLSQTFITRNLLLPYLSSLSISPVCISSLSIQLSIYLSLSLVLSLSLSLLDSWRGQLTGSSTLSIFFFLKPSSLDISFSSISLLYLSTLYIFSIHLSIYLSLVFIVLSSSPLLIGGTLFGMAVFAETSESVSDWLSDWVNEWLSDWVNEWVSANHYVLSLTRSPSYSHFHTHIHTHPHTLTHTHSSPHSTTAWAAFSHPLMVTASMLDSLLLVMFSILSLSLSLPISYRFSCSAWHTNTRTQNKYALHSWWGISRACAHIWVRRGLFRCLCCGQHLYCYCAECVHSRHKKSGVCGFFIKINTITIDVFINT